MFLFNTKIYICIINHKLGYFCHDVVIFSHFGREKFPDLVILFVKLHRS